MRNKVLFISLALLLLGAFWAFLPISHADNFEPEEESEAADNPIARAEYEFNMLKNPFTNAIPEGIFEKEIQQARTIYRKQLSMRTDGVNVYTYQGPNNLGGRTRTITYDVRFNGSTNQIILAGGVSGGVFKSVDNGATWVRKSPLNQLYSVTSIAQDPRPGFQDTWYYATGEAIGNSAGSAGSFYVGNGIYKSTDNGETWTRLPNSNPSAFETFDAVQDLITKVAVNPVNGDVYISALSTILRSQNGGTNWSAVLNGSANSSSQVTDVEITSTGRVYAAFSGTCPASVDGVWTSTTGNAGTWSRLAGTGVTVTGWSVQGSYGRVTMAIAPSNENIVYVLYDNFQSNPLLEASFFKYDQSTGTWTDRSANLPDEAGSSVGNDPFAIQGGYDLVVTVKPDDPNTVFIGGTNIYRSTDGFATTTNYKRIGGYAGPSSYALYTNSHSDIHAITIQPGSPQTMICGNDGGIQRTTNNLAATVAWTDISNAYRTYQYYYVAMDPRSGNSKVMGGAQDNATTRNIGGTGIDFEKVWSGDGGSVGLSDNIAGSTYEYVSSQQGAVSRRVSTAAPNLGNNIRPSTATDAGLFVTLFKLDDDNTQTIYYASDSSLYRNTSASTASTINWTKLTGVQNTVVDGLPNGKAQITALTTSRGTYNAATSSLFIGTNEGRLFRLDNPANAAAATNPVNITGAGFAGYISSIAVNPRNDDTLMVTFSNYGVTSVWWTGNANSATPTWQNVEGNLTLPSFRSSAIAVTNTSVDYFVGTSVGLYKTTINGTSPGLTTWAQEGSFDLGNAIITSLAYRPVDGKLLVGTHGYGMWTTTLNLTTLPVRYTEFSGTLVNNSSRLKWTTSSENRNKGFEIQRSYDGISFKEIGFVSGAGTSSSTTTYSFIDNDIAQDENYYRLRQIDIDGAAVYSSIVLIKNKLASSSNIKVLKNPFSDHLDIQLPKRESRQATARLIDMNGRVVYSSMLSLDLNRVRLNLGGVNLTSGVYILQIMDGQKQYSSKVIRQ